MTEWCSPGGILLNALHRDTRVAPERIAVRECVLPEETSKRLS